MSKIGRIYQGLEEIQKYYQGGVLQKLFFDWKHYIGTELNIEYGKECAGRNVVISGKTYQNLLNGIRRVSSLWSETDDSYSLDIKTGQPMITHYSTLIKPSTTYTLIINITDYTAGVIHTSIMNNTNDATIKVASNEKQIYRKGVHKVTLTTKNNIVDSYLRIFPRANTQNTYSISKNILLLEGDYTNIDLPTSIDGIESVAENELNVLNIVNRGKNLFDPNNLESGSINPSSGANVANSAQVRSINFIEAKPSTSYMFNDSCRIFEYSKTKGYIGSSVIKSQSFITSSNTYFLKLHKTIPENGLIENIQLEEGTVATSYEPYRESITTTLNLPIPLRSLPNGVCDTVEENKLVQRVEKIVLDGSNAGNFKQVNNMQVFRWEYFFEIRDFISGLCDKFPIKNVESLINENKGIRLSGTSFRGIDIKFPNDTGFDINSFRTWLSENPVTVYYELTTPIETEITPDMILINGEPITDTVGIELPNGIKDSIENSCYVKRVGKVVLDGSEDEEWEIESTTHNNLMNASILIESACDKSREDIEKGKIGYFFFSDKLPNQCTGIASTTTEGIMMNKMYIYVRILLSKLSSQDIDGLRNYLSENPVTVWYELATPIKIPLFSIKEGLTTLKSTNNITPQIELDCLVRDGFQNMCDNAWEKGDINLDTGVNEDSTNRIRLVNDIQVKSNTTYRIDTVSSVNLTTNNANVDARYYGISKTYISGGLIGNIKSSTYTFTTPENCYYVRFIVETTDTNFKIYLKEVIN